MAVLNLVPVCVLNMPFGHTSPEMRPNIVPAWVPVWIEENNTMPVPVRCGYTGQHRNILIPYVISARTSDSQRGARGAGCTLHEDGTTGGGSSSSSDSRFQQQRGGGCERTVTESQRGAVPQSSALHCMAAACGGATMDCMQQQHAHVLVVVVRHGERLDESDRASWRQMLKDCRRERGAAAAQILQRDPPLTREGAAQAQRAGAKLSSHLFQEMAGQDMPPLCVFTSPLGRTVTTAVELVKALGEPAAIIAHHGLNCCAAAKLHGVATVCPANPPTGIDGVLWPPHGDPHRIDRRHQGHEGGLVATVLELAQQSSAIAAGGQLGAKATAAVCVLVTHREAIWELQKAAMEAVGGSTYACSVHSSRSPVMFLFPRVVSRLTKSCFPFWRPELLGAAGGRSKYCSIHAFDAYVPQESAATNGGSLMPHHWRTPVVKQKVQSGRQAGGRDAKDAGDADLELQNLLIEVLTKRRAVENASTLERSAGSVDDAGPPETTAELHELAAMLASGTGQVVFHRWDATGTNAPVKLWRTPGVRGDWVVGTAIESGEMLQLLGPAVEAEGGEGFFCRVSRIHEGSDGHSGWTKVKNVRLPKPVK
eukprot:SAG31_NODE_4195_length_3484_cov_1.533235_2_plen_595_part_00